MTVTKIRTDVSAVKQLLASDQEFLKPLIQAAVQETLEAEMTEALGAEKGERSEERLGYRSGYYTRSLITRVGKIELRVPQDRAGRFSTELFERYQRSEKALVAALAEMYVQGVSTRKVKQVTEELVGHAFSASAISAINKRLDASLKAFCERKLKEPFAYLILDARYERVREDGIIASQAVLIAIGVDWEGRRQVLAVELANRESRSSWKEFLEALKARGLHGVEFVVSDDHPGLKKAIAEVLSGVGNAAMCTYCAMRSTMCRAKSTTIACLSFGGCTTGAISPRYDAIWRRGGQMGWQVPQAHRLGGGEHRGDAHLLPPAAGPPQAHEVDQHAGASQRGNQAAHLRGPNLPQCRQLSAARSRAHHRAPRDLARGSPLSEHGSIAQKAGDAPSGLTMLRPTKGMHATPSTPPSLATLRFGQASDGGSEGMA